MATAHHEIVPGRHNFFNMAVSPLFSNDFDYLRRFCLSPRQLNPGRTYRLSKTLSETGQR